jgi:hypothetical protein
MYWSGTNCVAGGSAVNISAGEVGIEEYEVRVNGTVVYSGPKDGAATGSCSGGARFDSTYFGNLSTVEIKTYAKAKRDDGTITPWQNDGGYSAVVKNEAMCAQAGDYRSYSGGAGDSTFTLLFGLTQYETEKLIMTWTAVDYFDMMRGKNVVFFNGHGAPGGTSHVSSSSLTAPGGDYIFPDSYQHPTDGWIPGYDIRIDHMGDNLPPRNSTGVPPVNLMWHYSCQTGLQTGFVKVLWPFQTENSPPLENQANTGFRDYVAVTSCYDVTYRVCLHLLQHDETIARTIERLIEDAAEGDLPEFIMETPTSFPRELRSGDVIMHGDPHTRISGVYTGSAAKHGEWYR